MVPRMPTVRAPRCLIAASTAGMALMIGNGDSTANTAAACVVPAGEAMQRVHDAYIAMAGEGRVSDAQRAVFLSAGAQMTREQGADAIMLGGTDLFLAFDDADPGFPLIDCAAIHIDAIYQRSIASE
jgi:aspartate racemase